VIIQQILSNTWQRKQSSHNLPFHQSGLSDCPIRIIAARRPIQIVIVDNEGIVVRNTDVRAPVRAVYGSSIPSVFDRRRSIKHQPENRASRMTARFRARAEYLTRQDPFLTACFDARMASSKH
jgi:hypothetical protein